MNNKKDLRLLRERIAEQCIGPSTLRNQGAKNVLMRARTHLKSITLKNFSKIKRSHFDKILNKETDKLKNALPLGARNWGAARKVLNLFIRDAVYNRHLCEAYGLKRIERFTEVPLDSFVAKALIATKEGEELPKWKTIKHLTKEESGKFQEVAEIVAKRNKTRRVHLDLYCWRQKNPKL